jgi:hypothetical protein
MLDWNVISEAIGYGTLFLSASAAWSFYLWVKHRIDSAADQREERQAAARAEDRHRRRMETLDKLETVASIVIADQSIATTLRDKIDAEYPRVRVEAQEAEVRSEEEEEERETKRSKRRGGRR